MSGVAVRAATAADAGAVIALWNRAADPGATDDPAALAALLARDPGALLVAEESGRIAGSVIAGWDGWRGMLYRLAVDPPVRGRGVGSALVRAAEERLAALGARRVVAIVDECPERRAFWRASGYETDEGIRRYVRTITGERAG